MKMILEREQGKRIPQNSSFTNFMKAFMVICQKYKKK